jgi:putative tricarboxylic transport membrane protein
MHASQQWKDELSKKGWTDTFLTGSEFSTFMAKEIGRVKPALQDIGLVK